MSTSRRQYTTPIIVEVKPNNVNAPSSFAPSTPPSPKTVRFAPRYSELVTGVSRPLNPTEAWSLYHFEFHARSCQDCKDPYSVYLNGRCLCPTGHALAQDVAIHVYHCEGEVYSTKKDNQKSVRVEISHDYDQVRGLLRSFDHGVRRAGRTVPIISYDKTYPISPRRRKPESETDGEDRTEVIVEPARTSRRPNHASTRYRVIDARNDDEESLASQVRRRETEERSKRGSLYEKDTRRPRREYLVEIREPAKAEQRPRARERERERPRESDRKQKGDKDREERRRRKDDRQN